MKQIIPKTNIVFELNIVKNDQENYTIFNFDLLLIRPNCDILWFYIELFGIYLQFRIYDKRWYKEEEVK